MKTQSLLARALLVSTIAGVAACSASTDEAAQGGEDDLTSLSARARALSFQGQVYVDPSASDATILQTVRSQTQTAFGALRTSNVAVNSRELKGVDPATFKKRAVTVVDTNVANDPGKPMIEVRYTYKDSAVVAVSPAKRSGVPIAVMNPNYRNQTDRILKECTANDSEAQEFSDSIWYVFEPSVSSCRTAMKKEQDTVDADRAKLKDATKQVTRSQVDRLYIPITASLGADKTNKGTSYPDYQKLYAGGVQKDKLVVGLVYGLIDHDHSAGPAKDFGYGEFMTNMSEIYKARAGFKLIKSEPEVDLASYTLKSGKKVANITFDDIIAWNTDDSGYPDGLSYSDKDDLKTQAGERIYRHWLTFELPVTVQIGSAAPKPFAIQLLTYFGAESDDTVHKFGIKNSDVFLYNGHSYIGFGPLDPSRFTSADFPESYQILFIDGCVSYNYYEKDYIPLKKGGTLNLDLITNGIEAPSGSSGYALGRFVARLLDGNAASYKDLLNEASATDALRVVDGELDNVFTPAKFPIKVSPR